MSTAEDYVQFGQMMLNGGELNGKRLVKSENDRAHDIQSHRRHGQRPVRAAPARDGFRVEHAGRSGSRGCRSGRFQGAYGWAGGTGVSFWVEPQEKDRVDFFHSGRRWRPPTGLRARGETGDYRVGHVAQGFSPRSPIPAALSAATSEADVTDGAVGIVHADRAASCGPCRVWVVIDSGEVQILLRGPGPEFPRARDRPGAPPYSRG